MDNENSKIICSPIPKTSIMLIKVDKSALKLYVSTVQHVQITTGSRALNARAMKS